MKPIIFLLLIRCYPAAAQTSEFEKSKNWKLYDVAGSNLFKYSVDTLKAFPFYVLNGDSVREFLDGIRELSADDLPVWMGGPQVASYELNGVKYKIDISQYGGFFFDERTRKYFQIKQREIDEWHSYIRECFVSLHQGNRTHIMDLNNR